MENRRPPHSKPTGRFADRSRGNAPNRSGGGGDGQSRGTRKPERGWDSRDDRRPDSNADSRRSGGPQTRNDGNRFSDRNRFGYKPQERPRGRTQPGRNKIQDEQPLIKLTSDSQITDGKFRGKSLHNSDSPNCTHTNRKVREVAFRILSRRVKACRILDLGAASGTFGIEAISRGAMLATFVERSARMCTYIKKNLTELGIKDGHGEVIEMEILPYLKRNARRRRTWDIVYIDLPDGDAHVAILDYLSRGHTIRQSGLLIIQHASSRSYPEKLSQLNRWRIVDQGETILTIYERM
ncbi:MAG TPA: RsmD family RNA methyltransferase [Pyrinomonadaceae bacterium]|nr:RsmD family RNA methyltransferase [Pyrinomonadaceae bacterium]